jgi:hypothetical protein
VIWRRSPQTAAAEDIEPSHAAVIRRAWQRRPLGGLMATVDVQLRPIGGLMATVDVQLRLLAGVKLREPGRISTLAVAIAPQRSPSRRNGRHRAATVAIAPQRSPSRRNGRHRAATVAIAPQRSTLTLETVAIAPQRSTLTLETVRTCLAGASGRSHTRCGRILVGDSGRNRRQAARRTDGRPQCDGGCRRSREKLDKRARGAEGVSALRAPCDRGPAIGLSLGVLVLDGLRVLAPLVPAARGARRVGQNSFSAARALGQRRWLGLPLRTTGPRPRS